MTADKELSLIIPTYNESENIVILLEQLTRVLAPFDHEILVVDDNSPDGTATAAEKFSVQHPTVAVLRRENKERGLSLSVVDGFNAAKGRFLGVMDADLSHDPAILPSMLNAVRGGFDAAVGSRRVAGGGVENWPWFRRMHSNVATAVAGFLFSLPLSDPMSGYFLVRRDVYENVRSGLNPKGYKILLELLIRARVTKVKEVPFIFRDRTLGYSKLTGSVAAHYLVMLWDLRSYFRFFRKK